MRRSRNPQDGVETLLIYRPKRHSIDCLRASLETLVEATELPHAVTVVVQGGWRSRQCRGLLQLPHSSEFSFSLNYAMNETDIGDAPVMARSLRECTSRYWAFLPGDILLTSGTWDTMFRCMRNEDRRKVFKTVGATVSCIDDLEPSKRLRSVDGTILLAKGSMATREERFAVWHVVDYVPLGPLVVVRDMLAKSECCFDEEYEHGGHIVDLCMQIRKASMVFLHIEQPATQMNIGCVDLDCEYEPLPEMSRKRFIEKWGSVERRFTGLE